MKITINANDVGLAILRIGISLLMLPHGYGKLNMLISGDEIKFPSIFGINATICLAIAVIGEFVAPILILLGFRTRQAAIPAIIVMGVAAFIFHAGDAFAKREPSLMYFVCFLAIAFLGGGKYTLDNYLNRKY